MDDREAPPKSLLFGNMLDLEQYAAAVTDYTSRYNTEMCFSYAPENLTGPPVEYPKYGDFPDTYMPRTYGRWWRESGSAQRSYAPRDDGDDPAEDFVCVRFEAAVVPTAVIVYETYNPGAIVRIWGRFGSERWTVLWEERRLTVLPQSSRKFAVQLRNVTNLIDEIRLDLNHSLLNYNTALDAILLSGKLPRSDLQLNLLRKGFLNVPKTDAIGESYCYDETAPSYFSLLPPEVMVKILSHLDMKSLSRCAQVNKTWQLLVNDTTIYRHLSLKRYWNRVNDAVITSLIPKCTMLRKLDLSWCGESNLISEEVFVKFLEQSCKNLTHLSLNHCKFVKDASIEVISRIETLSELRLKDCRPDSWIGLTRGSLKHLKTLDLNSTSITDATLIHVLKSNKSLKHLVIDLCEHLRQMDTITETIATFNKSLITFSSWKTHTLTPAGLANLAKCSNIEEIDVGWRRTPTRDPTEAFAAIAGSCVKLKRLILSGWRNATDANLTPIVLNCKELRQLDLLGIKNVSSDVCRKALEHLKLLELLDISFCDGISNEEVGLWRELYPNVAIKRSCSFGIPTETWN